MDGLELEGPTSSAAIPAADSLPHDPDLCPVGSPEHDVLDAPAPPLDDDIDHDRCKYQSKDHQQSSTAAVLTDDLKQRIIKQVEYYFSDENMMNLIRKNKEGFVPISVIGSFRKLKRLTRNYAWIVAALREGIIIACEFKWEEENLPRDHSVENMRIKNICIREPHAVEESKKGSKSGYLITNTNKLIALVEYQTVEAAEKAVATLNDEQDWRNGLRVKLLKRMGNIMAREGKPGGDLILRRVTVVKHLIPSGMRSIITQMNIMMILLMKRRESTYPRRKMSRKVEIEDDQGDRDVTMEASMACAMALRRSHLLALGCLMEPEDSQWDVVALPFQIKVSKLHDIYICWQSLCSVL